MACGTNNPQEPAEQSTGMVKQASTYSECGSPFHYCGLDAHPVGVTCAGCPWGNCPLNGYDATLCAPNDSGGYTECGLVSGYGKTYCDPGFIRDDSHPEGPYLCAPQCQRSPNDEPTNCTLNRYNATRCIAEPVSR